MTFASTATNIPDDVGKMLSSVLRERFGSLSSPVKRLARSLGISEPTARSMFAGQLPSTPIFLSALGLVGPEAAAHVVSGVIGKQGVESTRLAAMEQSLKELARNVAEIRTSNSEGRARLRSVFGVGPAGVAGGEGAGAAGEAGEGGEPDGTSAGIALVQVRRSVDDLSRPDHEALRRYLSLDPVVSLDHVRDLVRADNLGRTGLAYKRPGHDWSVLPAPDNRLWEPTTEALPASSFAGNVVALRRDLDEAAESSSPILVNHAGALLRGERLLSFNSTVVRLGRRTPCGAAVVVTDFQRAGVAA